MEVSIARDFRPVPPERVSRVFMNRARGRIGMEINWGGEVERLAPTRMLAQNLGFRRALERFQEGRKLTPEAFRERGRVRAFAARQLLISGDGREAVELFRGQTIVAPEPGAGGDRAAALADGIAAWMLANLGPDGSLPYEYWPSWQRTFRWRLVSASHISGARSRSRRIGFTLIPSASRRNRRGGSGSLVGAGRTWKRRSDPVMRTAQSPSPSPSPEGGVAGSGEGGAAGSGAGAGELEPPASLLGPD